MGNRINWFDVEINGRDKGTVVRVYPEVGEPRTYGGVEEKQLTESTLKRLDSLAESQEIMPFFYNGWFSITIYNDR